MGKEAAQLSKEAEYIYIYSPPHLQVRTLPTLRVILRKKQGRDTPRVALRSLVHFTATLPSLSSVVAVTLPFPW